MKRPHKKLGAFLLVAFFALQVGACSAADMGDVAQYPGGDWAMEDAARDMDYAPSETGAYDENKGQKSEDGAFPGLDLDVSSDPNMKIIYTADMSIEVDNAADAINEITKEARQLGGYMSDSSYRTYNDRIFGTVTVRVPPENLGELTQKIGTLGKVLDSHLSSDDVSFEYVDLQARLDNALAQEAQLLEIMERTVEIEDVLAVRLELNYVQQEIEQYKGMLRYYDNLVDLSTLTVTVEEIYIPQSPEPSEHQGAIARWSFEYIWSRIVMGFNNSLAITLNVLGIMVIAASYLIFPVIIPAIIIVAVIIIVRKARKAKKNKANL